jgi:crotonobetainyl-CoA:carnitine CoA-transferase CaiB-like acyl-CoA transferase
MYQLLNGVRILDVSLLAPSMAGMHLADLGADVIKVEAPPYGDHTRLVGGSFRGGPSLSHLRWNRGKRSVGLDLRTPAGRSTYLELAKVADGVIDGLRAGAADRMGVGYEQLKAINPKLVYCSISGVGHTGPLRELATHGVFFDAYAGLVPVAFRSDGVPYIGPRGQSIGVNVAPHFAALGMVAGIVHAQRTGEGSRIDVAETDSAALFQSDAIFRELNSRVPAAQPNPTPWKDAVRYQYYGTSDDRFVIFQPYERKFWVNFCNAIDRRDLVGPDPTGPNSENQLDRADGNEALRLALVEIFKTRTQAEWVEFFITYNVPGGPVYSLSEMLSDVHFQARENLTTHTHPEVGQLNMPTTPIKVLGETFDVRSAPAAGQHTAEVLRDWLGYGEEQLKSLREKAAIG